MPRYNVHWRELCNVKIDAPDETVARDIWDAGNYDDNKVSREYDKPTITQVETIKESDVLEHIGMSIDELDTNQLAALHNQLYNGEPITGDDIEATEDWHLVPTEGAH